MDIAGLIKEQRKKLDLTQAELADMAGVSQQTISKLEKGTLDPSLKTLKAILVLFLMISF